MVITHKYIMKGKDLKLFFHKFQLSECILYGVYTHTHTPTQTRIYITLQFEKPRNLLR